MAVSREIESGTEAAELVLPESALRAREHLDSNDAIDARQIDLVIRGRNFILRGWVASAAEAQSAVAIAENVSGAFGVRDELQIDPNLREGDPVLVEVERVVPAFGEILIGSPEMLEDPDSEITADVGQAMANSEPWIPPELPMLPSDSEPRNLVLDDDDADAVEILVPPTLAGSTLRDDEALYEGTPPED